MGGHVSYFQDIVLVNMGGGYKVKLRGFTNWAKYIMPLDRLTQIRFAFHREVGKIELTGDKGHQLQCFIRRFNDKVIYLFSLGPNASFHEGGAPMRSRCCPFRMYNKDKPAKFRVEFLC